MFSITWTDFPEIWDNLEEVQNYEFSLPKELDISLFIEGDNYPVLQKLNQVYKEKIDFIYIDPPYNTGNTFTYNDDFSSLKSHTDSHSEWLSFMFRRLKLAQSLLCKSGCIFIAIDQSELYVLKLLCDTIFGEENFVNDFMWLHGKGKKDRWSRTLQQHTLCYAKNKLDLKPFIEIQKTSWANKNYDNDKRGAWFSGSISFSEKRSNQNHKNYFAITSPSGIIWERQWLCSKEEMQTYLKENRIYFGKAPLYNQVPRLKIFNNEEQEIIPKNIITTVESTRSAQNHLDSLLGTKNSFDNPKPVSLITHLLEISNLKKDAIILDFFAGSGTTFEGVLQLNKKDNGNRKVILIQKAEIPQKKCEFATISDLCWARLQKNAKDFAHKIQKIEFN